VYWIPKSKPELSVFLRHVLVLYIASLISCYDLAAGVEVSPAEIKAAVSSVINVNKDLLLEERYRTNGEIIYLFLICVSVFSRDSFSHSVTYEESQGANRNSVYPKLKCISCMSLFILGARRLLQTLTLKCVN